MPPTQDLGQAVSSVNSYCTIILEYLVVRHINIILIKLTCLHPTFSLVTLVRGVGGQAVQVGLSCPCRGFESGSVISQFLLHHNLGIFSCKRCEHYFSQTEMFSSIILVRGVGGKLSRLVYHAPPPTTPAQDLGQTVSSVNSYCTIILEYLVIRDVNIISAKLDCGLSVLKFWVGGKINHPGQLAPHPLSIRNPTEHLK